ncbi:hypothetical protein ACIA8O_25565 [Kitasatospora sp. NPDC051853]
MAAQRPVAADEYPFGGAGRRAARELIGFMDRWIDRRPVTFEEI